MAPQIRHDHAMPARRELRRYIYVAVDVVRPSMQQHRRPWSDVAVADAENAGVDLLDVDECVHVQSSKRSIVGCQARFGEIDLALQSGQHVVTNFTAAPKG